MVDRLCTARPCERTSSTLNDEWRCNDKPANCESVDTNVAQIPGRYGRFSFRSDSSISSTESFCSAKCAHLLIREVQQIRLKIASESTHHQSVYDGNVQLVPEDVPLLGQVAQGSLLVVQSLDTK